MMKRLLLALCLLTGIAWSAGSMAENIGIVNMREIVQSSPQIKKIDAELKKQFLPQRNKILEMTKKLKESINKLQKNQSVMDKKSLDSLRSSITSQEQELRTAQAKFQQAVYAAQNKAMSSFMQKITGVVELIAKKKDLDIALPKTTVLYAKGGTDITSDVISALKR